LRICIGRSGSVRLALRIAMDISATHTPRKMSIISGPKTIHGIGPYAPHQSLHHMGGSLADRARGGLIEINQRPDLRARVAA
jgi:hypothetical protein